MSLYELKSSLLGDRGGSSSSWELWVDKGESLELVLVQVLNHFLIGRGQHRWVACEKTVKVLSIPSTLLRRDGVQGRGGLGRGRSGDEEEWMDWGGVGWGGGLNRAALISACFDSDPRWPSLSRETPIISFSPNSC